MITVESLKIKCTFSNRLCTWLFLQRELVHSISYNYIKFCVHQILKIPISQFSPSTAWHPLPPPLNSDACIPCSRMNCSPFLTTVETKPCSPNYLSLFLEFILKKDYWGQQKHSCGGLWVNNFSGEITTQIVLQFWGCDDMFGPHSFWIEVSRFKTPLKYCKSYWWPYHQIQWWMIKVHLSEDFLLSSAISLPPKKLLIFYLFFDSLLVLFVPEFVSA